MVRFESTRVAEIGIRPWVTNNLNHRLCHDSWGVSGHILVLIEVLFVVVVVVVGGGGGVGGERGRGRRWSAQLGERRLRLAHPWEGVERRDALDSRGDHFGSKRHWFMLCARKEN